jgi:hypothetical protein
MRLKCHLCLFLFAVYIVCLAFIFSGGPHCAVSEAWKESVIMLCLLAVKI